MAAMMDRKTLSNLLKSTFQDWVDDGAPRLAAALAYYTLLSLAPILVLAVSVAALVFGEDAARGQIAAQIDQVVGPQAGRGIEAILAHAHAPDTGIMSSIISLVILLFGASGVFGELQYALDTIWDVETKPGRGVRGVIRDRFLSFTMVLGVAFLLLVSMLVSAALSAMGAFFSQHLPGGALLWEGFNFVISLGVITCLFALIFKVIPDVKIGFRDVWLGALVTALLFTIGKTFLGLYLGRESVSSPYGAAGSLIVLIIWVYYAAQIVFLGAEFTQAHARARGRRFTPGRNAVPLGRRMPYAEHAQLNNQWVETSS
jgi:membrane protein